MKKLTYLIILLPFLLEAQDWSTTIEGAYAFSSPRAVDLTGDGVKDIVLGAGHEDESSENGVVAFDGVTGEVLWRVPSREQMFGSALFRDISNDGVEDVFICGRDAQFLAINGATGEVIWEFYEGADAEDMGLFNFYNPQWVIDEDGDGLPDLLNTNGGDRRALLPSDPRPAGQLMLISSATGNLIASAEMPDGKETYMSPIACDLENDGILDIIFGSGGETIGGSLWRTTLVDLLEGDITGAIPLINGNNKGLLAPPSIVDLNNDGVFDIVAHMYDGRIVAISVNGGTPGILWEHSIEGAEIIASPTIGYFNDDPYPDVFTSVAIGVAPSFSEFRHLMLSGMDGSVEYEETLGFFNFSSPAAVDVDGNGIQEVLLSFNQFEDNLFTNQIDYIDFATGTRTTLIEAVPGANVNSSIWLGDLGDGGGLDLVYQHSPDNELATILQSLTLNKASLDISDQTDVPWGSYLGSDYNGFFFYDRPCHLNVTTELDLNCGGQATANLSLTIDDGTPPYRVYFDGEEGNPSFAEFYSFEALEEGDYSIKITDANDCQFTGFVNVDCIVSIDDWKDLAAAVNVVNSPFNSRIKIDVSLQNGQGLDFQLSDVSGRIIEKGRFSNDLQHQIQLNKRDLGSGLFFLRLMAGSSVTVLRFTGH